MDRANPLGIPTNMLLPLHLLSMGLAAGLVGACGRRLVAAQGWVPDFETGLLVTAGIAFAYLTVQGALLVFIQVIVPAKSRGLLVADMLSHASALILLLYLLPVSLPWPHPTLERGSDLIVLATFVGVHLFLKLLGLYAALETSSKERPALLTWVGLIALGLFGMVLCFRSASDPAAHTKYRTWVRGYITQYADTAVAQGQKLSEQL